MAVRIPPRRSLVLLIGLALLFSWREALGLAIPYFEDVVTLHYPMKVTLAHALGRLELPLWAPEILAGYPLAADGQVGAFYPPNILLFGLLPPANAYGLSLSLHLFLGATFMYGFVRRLGVDAMGAFVSATAFTFGGFFVGHITHLNFLHAGIWLPLAFSAADETARTSRLRPCVMWGGSIGMMLLASAPQLALYGAAGSGAYLLALLLHRTAGDSMARRLGLAIRLSLAGGAFAIGVAAVQLAPQLELALRSSREGGLAFGAAMLGSFPLPNLVTFVLPGAFGASHLDRYYYPGQPLHWWIASWWESAVYVGIVPLLLAALALRRPRRLETIVLATIGLAALLVAFGRYTPLGAVLHALPGFAYFRIPARATFVTTFAVAAMAGLGWSSLRSAADWSAAARLAGRFTVLLAAGLAALNVAGRLAAPWAIGWIDQRQQELLTRETGATLARHLDSATLATIRYQALLDSVSPADPLVTAPLLAAVALWIVALASRRPGAAGWLGVAPLAVTVADLLAFHAVLVPHTPLAVVREGSAVAARLETMVPPGRIWVTPDLDPWLIARYPPVRPEPESANPALLLREFLRPNVNMNHGIEAIQGANVLRTARYDEVLRLVETGAPGARRWLDLLGVRYVLSPLARTSDATLRPLERVGDVWIHENPNARPRAWLAPRFRVVDALDGSLRQAPPGWDPLVEVLLEEEAETAPAAGASRGSVDIVRSDQREVTVAASSPGGGILVLADLHYPGWKVYVDGAQRPLLRANYLMRAVVLSPGRHDVRFVYEPISVRAGLAVTLLALLGVAGVFALTSRRAGPDPASARRSSA